MSGAQCQGRTQGDSWGHTAQCMHQAHYYEEGKYYCHIHAPSKVTERRKKRDAAWVARSDAIVQKAISERRQRNEDWRKLAAHDSLVAALTMLKTHAELFGAFRDDVGQAVLGEVNAALAKAQG